MPALQSGPSMRKRNDAHPDKKSHWGAALSLLALNAARLALSLQAAPCNLQGVGEEE
jgi:hypothetical protein